MLQLCPQPLDLLLEFLLGFQLPLAEFLLNPSTLIGRADRHDSLLKFLRFVHLVLRVLPGKVLDLLLDLPLPGDILVAGPGYASSV